MFGHGKRDRVIVIVIVFKGAGQNLVFFIVVEMGVGVKSIVFNVKGVVI